MKKPFTPGPWQAAAASRYGLHTYQVWAGNALLADVGREANANLMAAAPSLLSELRMFVIQCPCGNHSHVITTNKCCQKCASAVAAIAAAETGGAA